MCVCVCGKRREWVAAAATVHFRERAGEAAGWIPALGDNSFPVIQSCRRAACDIYAPASVHIVYIYIQVRGGCLVYKGE